MSRFGVLLHGLPVTAEDVAELQEKLLFDRVPVRDRYIRFFVLMFLSSIIAAYGVVSNSTADVIGAMIIAPMMTPITAISLSIVTGDGRNIVRSLLVVVAGTALVVGLSYILAALIPGELSLSGNAEVASRTAPRLIDLVIALAAGAAGAFAASRDDISDALPGVAIAVSLVPPLAVVGITLSAGLPGEAWGAFLLFGTNFLAIAAAGLLMFTIMGYGGAAVGLSSKQARRWATAAVIISILIIAVPLGITGYRITTDQTLQLKTRSAVSQWLDDTGYELSSITAIGDQVDVVIIGDGEVPEFEELLFKLREKAGEITVEIKVLPEKTLQGDTGT